MGHQQHLTRRHPPLPTTSSPQLIRSRSGTDNPSTSLKSNTPPSFINRSKSTSKSTSNIIYKHKISTQNKLSDQESNCSSEHGSVKVIRCNGSQHNCGSTTRSKSASGSPSAWALSPGRSSMNPPLPREPPKVGGREGEKVKSGILNYFRKKKACPMQEEGYHRFRVLQNRMLQWRFANARAVSSMASVKIAAEGKIFHFWLRIINMRSSMLEKRIQIQRYKQEITFYNIINPQIRLLYEWAKLEGRNCEAVSRMVRKLSALSVRLPLVENAEGDVQSTFEAMSMAVQVMDSIQATITMSISQVEKILYLVTELASTVEHQNESLVEMEEIITSASKLVVSVSSEAGLGDKCEGTSHAPTRELGSGFKTSISF